jgi:hypothetical protein
MRHAARVAALILLVGAGWLTVSIVRGAEAEKAAPPAKDLTRAAVGAGTPAKSPVAPFRAVAPKATPTSTVADITPPAPMPDIDIPPIPEVGKEPYQPGPMPVRPKPADVLEEGKHLFNREGQLDMDPIGRSTFVFNSGDKPMYLLENSWREYLENITERGTKKIRWRVSGVVTVYGGRNYLLVTKVVHVLPEEEVK